MEHVLGRIDALQKQQGVEVVSVSEWSGFERTADNLRHLRGVEAGLLGAQTETRTKMERLQFEKLRDPVVGVMRVDAPRTTEHVHALRRDARDLRLARFAERIGSDEPTVDSIREAQRSWVREGADDSVALTMQCLDVQLHYRAKRNSLTTLYRLYGRLMNGRSVAIDVTGVASYLYALVPPADALRWRTNKGLCASLTDAMNEGLSYRLRPNPHVGCRRHECTCQFAKKPSSVFRPCFDPCVKVVAKHVRQIVAKCEVVSGRSLLGYHPEEQTFVKITVTYPFLLRCSMYWLRTQAKERHGLCEGFEPFEATVDPVTRFMVDTNLVGCGIVDFEGASLVSYDERETRCDVECSVGVDDMRSRPEATENAPIRVLALDIECMSVDVNVFPTADKCSVIQVSTLGRIFGQPEKDEKKVFCLGWTANNTADNQEAWKTDNLTTDGEIVNCRTEVELFHALYLYMLDFGGDVLTGFNSNKFDFPYLLERADALGIAWFRRLTKVLDKNPVHYYKQTFTSAQVGTKETIHYVWPGCVTMDVFELIKTNFKLRAYNLNAVSQHFLQDQKKDDMNYKDIPRFQKESSRTRGVMAKYCLQDTVLVVLLMDKLQLLTNNIAMARVVGVNMIDVWERGQSFKLLRKMLGYTSERKYYIPSFERNAEGMTYVPYYDTIENAQMEVETVDTMKQQTMDRHLTGGAATSKSKRKRDADVGRTIAFQGATVLEPTVGLHENPTCVLDFASLYPSIMRFWNLSYDSFLRSDAEAAAKGLAPDQVYTSPNGFKFVKKTVHEGILPMIETELLAARKRAKKQMAEATDPLTRSVFDGKQLALKVVCNSLYGFTGSNIGPIPCIPIASSVTSIGRQCIEASREWIQTTFPVLHPEQEQYRAAGKLAAECVYGDTDSVFIKFNTAGADGTNPVAQAIGWAQELDKIVNDTSTQTTASGRTVKGLFDLPMYLEYEKTFYPFLLLKKKKYLAMKFVFDPQGGKVSASGIETVRRDNALFCSETMQAFIDKVLQDNDREGALTVVRAAVQSLLNEEVPVEKLILSKKLSKMRYKTMLPHATVRKTIAAREPSRTPMLGDRIPYVIAAGAKGTKNALLARDPAFFVADGEKANVTYYIDKQLRQPLERLMNPIYGRAVVLETFRLSTYARSESQSGGALAVHLGASGVRTIQPSVAKTIKTAPPNRPITDFF